MRVPNGKSALVLGAGATGVASALFLYSRGWNVLVADTRDLQGKVDELEQYPEAIQLHFSGMPVSLLRADICLVVVSPGLSLEHSEATPIVEQARLRGIEVVGEIELFARELQRLKLFRGYAPIVIGITGTNGKTTTTTMVGLMAKASGKSVCVAGNIGPNALSELDRLLQSNQLPEVWVLELSSFQLQTTTQLQCDAAAFLNLTEDHIDWHGSLEAYAQAKSRIFSEKTIRVLNRDDAYTSSLIRSDGYSFGEDEPHKPGQWGISKDGEIEWLSWIEPSPVTVSKKAVLNEPVSQKILLMPLEALRVRGRHNAMNALAALALCQASGLNLAAALKVLSSYSGEAHRVQSVLTVNQVEFIDDSKGTNVGAVIAALVGLGKSKKKSVLIMGGDGKGQDFSPLADVIEQYARGVVLIGRDAEIIAQALHNCTVNIQHCGTDFSKAIDVAYAMALPGDAVLLSPACASWDMFKNYAQRSAQFVAKAKEIQSQFEVSVGAEE